MMSQMKHKVLLIFVLAWANGWSQPNYTDYVNPFIGTGGHGHTFPGAVVPFGMVQLSPDTRLEGWDGCSGYHYDDDRIYGFSHTHLSGTGVADWCDVLIKPLSRPITFDKEQYSSTFSHSREVARPGYYSVVLADDEIHAELTTTTRTGFHRYTFTKDKSQQIILDLIHRDEVLEASLEILPGNKAIRGMRRSRSWAEDQHVYFHIEFDRPFTHWVLNVDGIEYQRKTGIVESKTIQAGFQFDNRDVPLLVKVGMSQVSMDGAALNLAAENPEWDFDAVRESAQDRWNDALDKIRVKTRSRDDMVNFYTALYHSMIHPSMASDIDGQYRGMDGRVHKAIGYDHYNVFSLWDTYRALHPLLTITDIRRTNDFVRSMLSMHKQQGRLPVWELSSNETNCMIGYHAVSVIFDAWQKGIRNWDSDVALEAMTETANKPVFGISAYRAKGYLEIEDESESVSKTLEYAYNDWCIAEMASKKRKKEIHDTFLRRSIGYRHLFDPRTKFIRPRSNGGWLEPFDPREVTNHYTEANGWQYNFYTPHDMKWFIENSGGDAAFETHLDAFFESPSVLTGRTQSDITGLIGQYAQGNEPSHHAAYLYAYSGSPWKTQKRIDQIMELYKPTPDGLPGNEDCGQMSAWYVFSAMGFYPVIPGSGQYIFGSPRFEEVQIRREDNKYFVITSDRRTPSDKYISQVIVNGEVWPSSFIPHHFFKPNVDVEFIMSNHPNYQFGQANNFRPKSEVVWPDFVPIPAFKGPDTPFSDSTKVTLSAFSHSHNILYSLDQKTPHIPYMDPIKLDKTTTLTAVARDTSGAFSPIVQATYFKRPHDYSISIRSMVHPQYTAGGPESLIDGLHGDVHWRKGRWQGYQGTDFEAIVDMGSKEKLQSVSISFLQDYRAWIVFPIEVEVFTSRDGKEYDLVETLRPQRDLTDPTPQTITLSTTKKIGKSRFVKVLARNVGKLKEPHPGAGGDAYIFIDEITLIKK